MDPTLKPFFNPSGVVIIGASTDPGKLGYLVARNMTRSGYPGAIALVNPKGGEVFGLPIRSSLVEVPDPVDLAIILVPAQAAPETLREVARRGIKAFILSSGGFRETGEAGERLEMECLKITRQNGMRMIGPNCVGLLDFHLPMDTTFVTLPIPEKGHLALISQSGAVCGIVMDWAASLGVGFSRMLSLGNMADITETDMLPGIIEDEHTRVIMFYIESLQDGQRFMDVAMQANRVKPMVALKVGRSQAGKRAAASHTGALAGEATAYQAALRKAGILQAGTIDELLEWSVALSSCPLPKGDRIAILTNAGGPGVIAADALEGNQLKLAELDAKTVEYLSKLLPAAASLRNPVDMLGGATHEMYVKCLELLVADPGVDGIIVVLFPPPLEAAEINAEALIPVIKASSKPVLVTLPGKNSILKAAECLQAAQLPEYRSAEHAVATMGALVRRHEYLSHPQETPVKWQDTDLQAAREALATCPAGSIPDVDVLWKVMSAYGIRTSEGRLARSEEEAVVLAESLGFPVVLKVASTDIVHKSDVGGVLLGIQDKASARQGFRDVMSKAAAARPDARLEGVLVQPMAKSGQEVIIGARRDPQFGPLIMFGSGGVEVEGLKDVAFALPPLTSGETHDLIQRTWAGRKLAGYRSLAPADTAAVEEALQRLAQLAIDLPEIDEIEINPLRVMAPGEGVIALDVRARLGSRNG